MSKFLAGIVLAALLFGLSHYLFGNGLITRFAELSAGLTSGEHTQALVGGQADATGDMSTALGFVIEVGLYYLLAAIIIFIFGLFSSDKKKVELNKQNMK